MNCFSATGHWKKYGLLACLLTSHLSVNAEERLDLLDMFQLAQENDSQFSAARFRRESVRELKSQSIAVLLPTISATGRSSWNYLRNKKVSFQGVGIQRYWNHVGEVNISQPIFNYQSWVLLNQAEHTIAKAEAQFADAFQQLMIRSATSYLNLLLSAESVALTQAEITAQQSTLEQAEARFEVGLAPVTDLLEAQAKHAQSTAELATADSLLVDAQAALDEIIGVQQVLSLAPLQERFQLEKPDPADIEQWQAYAQARNRSLMVAISDMEVARQQVESEKTAHYPVIEGIASYSFNDNNSTFGLRGETGAVGVQVTVPLFQGGLVSSKVRQAHFDFQASQQSLETTRRSVERTVRKSYFTVLASVSRVQALQQSEHSFSRRLEATEIGLESGTHTLVDVLDAQTDLYRVKRDLSEAKHNYLIHWMNLRYAAGLLEQDDLLLLNHYFVNATEASTP